jgi:branched-chain amino acid transport system permease protein
MLQYVLAGLALGSIYAIASSSLVITFVSAGVLNFAFGSMAYFVARFYYFLNSQHGWTTTAAGAVSILVVGPLLGVLLYFALFQFIRGKSTLVKLVATIGLSVALPPLADLTVKLLAGHLGFDSTSITSAPGLASLSDKPYHFLGSPVTTDQLITYGFLLFVLVVGTFVLRFTDVGLKVRATVDSEAMASLSGTNPGRISLGVWAVSAMLAGLAGILVAPTNGLDVAGMTALMAAAFAAMVVARLRSLPGVIAVSLVMGVVTDVIQKYLPANSSFTAAIIPSVPFIFIVVALVFWLIRSGSLDEDAGVAGPLDLAIRPATLDTQGMSSETARLTPTALGLSAIPLVLVAALPLIFKGSSYWLGLTALGLCFAITFLTFTVVTGEGGMLWLSQIIFAGAGALAVGQFASVYHLPVLLAVVIGGLIAAAAGAIIGVLTIRLGDLYVALVTLTFGLLVETLLFTRSRFLRGGPGVPVNRPSFARTDLSFSYLALVVFFILAILTVNLRRSTSGLALRAVRDSEKASRTLGLSVLQVKVIVGAIAAFIAAVGGGFLAMDQNSAQPSSYDTFLGLVWLAVVVTLGIRSIIAAALAGVSFQLLPGVFSTYVPTKWAEVPTLLFGLGAIGVARNPDGVVTQVGRQVRGLLAGLAGGGDRTVVPQGAGPPIPGGAEVGVKAKAAP